MLGVVGTLPRRHRQAIARVSVSALVASLPLLYVSLLRPPPAALAGDTAFWFLMSNCVIAAIVATADDAGTLFFGSSNDDDDPPRDEERDDGHVSSPVPFAAVNDEAAVVVTTTMKGRSVQEEVVADSNPVDLLDLQPNHHMLVSALGPQRGERHEAAMERNTDDKNNTAVMMVVEGQGEEVVEVGGGEIASPVLQASDDRVLAEPPETETEPWAPKLVTSKSLPDQEEAANQEWPRAPDVLPHGKGGGGRLRRSATDASKSAAEERESDYYWQLSDEELNRRVEDFIARFNRQMRLQIEQEAAI